MNEEDRSEGGGRAGTVVKSQSIEDLYDLGSLGELLAEMERAQCDEATARYIDKLIASLEFDDSP